MKNLQKDKQLKKKRRIGRVRSRIAGTNEKPRLAVFRSLTHISAQLIDDEHGKTLASVSDNELKGSKGNKTEKAFEAGKILAEKALAKKISQAVLDRRGCKYHGRIRAFAEGAREGGLSL